jgi:hypothetical protein
MVGHGGSATAEESIYDERAAGKGVVRIASVAALGGFLFGYDSAVINGAAAAVEREFNADAAARHSARFELPTSPAQWAHTVLGDSDGTGGRRVAFKLSRGDRTIRRHHHHRRRTRPCRARARARS